VREGVSEWAREGLGERDDPELLLLHAFSVLPHARISGSETFVYVKYLEKDLASETMPSSSSCTLSVLPERECVSE